MSNYVLVVDTNRKPLDPIHPGQARKLLNDKKAAIFRRYPFTLILKEAFPLAVTKPIKLKLDPGSKTTGIALVQAEKNEEKVIFGAELQHRGNAIKDSIRTRKSVRRSRRNRKTRYREARFLNRKRPDGWLPPSLRHRVETTITWVKRLTKLAPVIEVFQELVKFDLQKLENPEISGIEYQQGELQGYEVREYLLEKWGRKCAYCNAENLPFQIEHIHPKSKGGSNRISNLTLSCERCNLKKGSDDIEVFLAKKPEILDKIKKQSKLPLKDATAVNSTGLALLDVLKLIGLPVTTASGGKTKYNRANFDLPKTHWIDAACVGNVNNIKVLTKVPLIIKSTGKGTRRLCRMNKFGFPCSNARKGYDHEWNTGDIARCISGKSKGVVGRIVVQSDTRLEIRIGKDRIGGKLSAFKKIHSKDSYSYV